jgi:hypothetical protein
MYTKITHHITEEHFAHMDAATIKKATDSKMMANAKSASNMKTKSFFYFEDKDLSSIERASINAWAQLNWRIRNLITSIIIGEDDVEVLSARLASDIDAICAIIAPYVTADEATQFKTALGALWSSLLDVVKAVKLGTNTTVLMTALTANIDAFATLVHAVNSGWDNFAVADIFTKVADLYVTQAQSRLSKEWDKGTDAADQAYNLMVVTQDGSNPSFADIFSNGIKEIDELDGLESY